MKVVLDNNVVIDALKPRKNFGSEAQAVFRAIGEDKFEPFVTANSLTDIYYVLRRDSGSNASKVKAIVANLMSVVNVIPLTEADCSDALALPTDDFEDAVISVCAQKVGADCIVSRDEKFINSKTVVEVIKPKQMLSRLSLLNK